MIYNVKHVNFTKKNIYRGELKMLRVKHVDFFFVKFPGNLYLYY